MPSTSLCRSCAHVRLVEGRLGQTYLLCRNDAIAAKYPQQPVLRCAGYTPVAAPAAPPAAPPPGPPAAPSAPAGEAPAGIVTPDLA